VGLAEVVPFLLETRLRELGGRFEGGPDWQPFAARDGNLITGQNPMSSELLARRVIEALEAQEVARGRAASWFGGTGLRPVTGNAARRGWSGC
jgi:hypothetical protein